MKQLIGYVVGAVAVIILLLVFYTSLYTPVTTLYIVRHAERLNDSDTTSLSVEGLSRAADLAAIIREAGIKRIYITERQRTAQTAAPAAEFLHLDPVIIPASQVDALVDSLKGVRGRTALVVGHSDTVPAIMRRFGIHPPPVIARDVFDDLFVLTVFPFRSSVAHLKYGARS